MDSDSLPTEFDAIVLGTGMCESIVAAALARIGLRVLHIDRYENYGGDWASYNFSALQQWIANHKQASDTKPLDLSLASSLLNEDERFLVLPTESEMVSNVRETVHMSESIPVPTTGGSADVKTVSAENCDASLDTQSSELTSEASSQQQSTEVENAQSGDTSAAATDSIEESTPTSHSEDTEEAAGFEKGTTRAWSLSDVKHQWRKFNIDLMPKLLYCRGPLVDLLISSDVAKYCEFRSVSRVLTVIKDKLEKVPCSRADVFASHNVGVIEKRMLMKLLTFCLEFDKNSTEFAGFENKSFSDFLKSKNLTDTVRHYVQRAIAMVPDTATTLEGLTATQRFLQSLGRYGNTAFLWPIYGSGELPQCFARMCAVFGGIYCLRRQATAVIVNKENKLTAVITSNGQRINTKWLVMEASYASRELIPNFNVTCRISRAILLTDRSLEPDKQEHITLLSVPLPGVNDTTVTIYELSSISMACPDKLYVVHLTCRSHAEDAKDDLQPVVSSLFSLADDKDADSNKPRILWSLYFNVNNTSRCDLSTNVDNVLVIGGPDEYIDYDNAVIEAKRTFEKIFPGEEFLPKAPNPEDIIYDDGEPSGTGESGFEASAQGHISAADADDTAATAAAAASVTSGVSSLMCDEAASKQDPAGAQAEVKSPELIENPKIAAVDR